ncbi:MAG TPA: TetR family transcriptional regulator [Acidimicrobiia bacterium]|nr:TetR family transcriptional regulator [Acidimicrobiia bacterium]
MARDATDTRETLLRTAQQMFARDGIYQVPLKRIVETAGQRNASALHYHFGGRDGLLVAITARHDGEIEDERAALLATLRLERRLDDLRALVEALVVPFAHKLADQEGREYLRIVEQLVGLFDLWDVEVAGGPTGAQQVLFHIQSQLDHLPQPLRHERVTILLALVSETLAMRARALEDAGAPPVLDHVAFVTNLVDMAVGALSAPASPAP